MHAFPLCGPPPVVCRENLHNMCVCALQHTKHIYNLQPDTYAYIPPLPTSYYMVLCDDDDDERTDAQRHWAPCVFLCSVVDKLSTPPANHHTTTAQHSTTPHRTPQHSRAKRDTVCASRSRRDRGNAMRSLSNRTRTPPVRPSLLPRYIHIVVVYVYV